jgi:hypothetical protein
MILALAAAGCGGAATNPAGNDSPAVVHNQNTWTKQDVIDALDLYIPKTSSPEIDAWNQANGLGYQTPSGISIAVILTSKAQVQMYAGAGDPVATNPAGDAGVKFGGEPEQGEELAAGLATLK